MLNELAIADESPDALVALTGDGAVRFWNRRAEEMYGFPRAEVLGRPFEDLVVPPQRRGELLRHIEKALEGEAVEFASERCRKDGSTLGVEVSLRAVRAPAGDLVCLLASEKNVAGLSHLRQAEMLESRFRGFLDAMPDAVIIVDRAGRMLMTNTQAHALFCYSRAELLGQPVELLVPRRLARAHESYRASYFAEPRVRPMGAGRELYGSRKDGSEFPVEISLSPMEANGEILVVSTLRDVSDRKSLEENIRRKNQELEAQNRRVEEANRMKSDFLANMSHELRTPLNSILGFAELMHDGRVGPVAPRHQEFLGDILSSGRHLLRLINDLLDVAKIEAGKLEFCPVEIDLGPLIAESTAMLRAVAEQRCVELSTSVDPGLGIVVVDSVRLQQVLYNYLSNALKFTAEGGKVAVRAAPEAPASFRIEVEDTGIGVAPERLHRLFVEFEQLESGASKRYPGTGLGLALSKRLIERMGGSVGVRSAPGRGSTFYLSLPIRPKQASGEEGEWTSARAKS